LRTFIISLFIFVVSTSLGAANYYDILGVSSSSSEKEIKTAYRRMAQAFHPDKKSAWEKTMGLAQAEKKFKEINEANSTLRDSAKRAAYDRTLSTSKSTVNRGPKPSAKKWTPEDFGQKKQKPRPAPKADLVAEYLKKMRADFSLVKNKSAKAFAEYVTMMSERAKNLDASARPKLQEALTKFLDSTADAFFSTNPSFEELEKVKIAHFTDNKRLELDRKWLTKSSTRADYIHRVEMLMGDQSRDVFLRKNGAILDTTASELFGSGANSKNVFAEIDQIKNLERMKAEQARARPTYDRPEARPKKSSSSSSSIPSGAGGTCKAPQALKAFEVYLNTQLGPSSAGKIIDLRI
jgi:curved DNA-binding protein CbpA